jgi:plasmid stability protein
MVSITIRDVPEAARAQLAARAARQGRSMQEYLRMQLIELAERVDPEEWLVRVQDRKRRLGSRLAAEDIIEARDAERR